MGDLGVDTAVTQHEDGRLTANLSSDWRIWGPAGGYAAAVALRAVGLVSPMRRPASFFCQFHTVAEFAAVDLDVTELRRTRSAMAHRVQMRQGERLILEATVWSVEDGLGGFTHDVTEPPAVDGPDVAKPLSAYLSDEELAAGPPMAFWSNMEQRILEFRRPPFEPSAPIFRTWSRFDPAPDLNDPWIDACRTLVLIDVQSWPSAARAYGEQSQGWFAPSLDLYVAFHKPRPDVEWLLCDGLSPLSADGLIGWNGRLWTSDGTLVASGAGQLLWREIAKRA